MYIVEDIQNVLHWYVEGKSDYVTLEQLSEAHDSFESDYVAMRHGDEPNNWRAVWVQNFPNYKNTMKNFTLLIAALEHPAACEIEG